MNYNSNFSHDLEVGQVGEKALGNILENSKIEVKTDFGTQSTGNVFVEYESRGRPSGIATSEADYWAFIISQSQIIIIRTETLKDIARGQFSNPSRLVLGGDNNTSKGVLIKVEELVQ